MVAFERRWSRGEKEQVSLRGLSFLTQADDWKKERGKKAKIVTSGRRPTRRHSCKSWPCDTWLYANYNITRDPRTAAHAPTWPVSVSSFSSWGRFSVQRPSGSRCVSWLLCVWESEGVAPCTRNTRTSATRSLCVWGRGWTQLRCIRNNNNKTTTEASGLFPLRKFIIGILLVSADSLNADFGKACSVLWKPSNSLNDCWHHTCTFVFVAEVVNFRRENLFRHYDAIIGFQRCVLLWSTKQHKDSCWWSSLDTQSQYCTSSSTPPMLWKRWYWYSRRSQPACATAVSTASTDRGRG